MKRCKNCRHWIDEPWVDRPHKSCGNEEKFQYQELEKEDNLVYWDNEGYSAGFSTGPEFGCVHWGQK